MNSSSLHARLAPHGAGVAAGTLLLVLAIACGTAWAARTFPPNTTQAKISAVADDSIVADGTALHLSPGVIIFTPTNATLVRTALPVGAIVRIQLDQSGDVRRIWILADDEILTRPWWQFFLRSQPQRLTP